MTKRKRYTIIACCIMAAVLILDQMLKIWVKTHMMLGQMNPVLGNWFNLLFVENEGMAFGISFGANVGKLLLSLFRIVLVGAIGWYMFRQIKRDKMDGLTLTIFSLVIAGALGNILDSLFYGVMFSASTPVNVATMFPDGGGYAPVLFGKVVDMFYFKLFPIPSWFPLWGGQHFFPAIFNFADSCVTVGIFLMIIFSKRIFKMEEERKIVDEAIES